MIMSAMEEFACSLCSSRQALVVVLVALDVGAVVDVVVAKGTAEAAVVVAEVVAAEAVVVAVAAVVAAVDAVAAA